MSNDDPQTAKYGVTLCAQITGPAKDAGIAEQSHGEELYKTDSLQQTRVDHDGGSVAFHYDLEQLPMTKVASHLRSVANAVGVREQEFTTKTICPHVRGNGYCVPLGILSDKWEEKQDLTINHAEGFIAIGEADSGATDPSIEALVQASANWFDRSAKPFPKHLKESEEWFALSQ